MLRAVSKILVLFFSTILFMSCYSSNSQVPVGGPPTVTVTTNLSDVHAVRSQTRQILVTAVVRNDHSVPMVGQYVRFQATAAHGTITSIAYAGSDSTSDSSGVVTANLSVTIDSTDSISVTAMLRDNTTIRNVATVRCAEIFAHSIAVTPRTLSIHGFQGQAIGAGIDALVRDNFNDPMLGQGVSFQIIARPTTMASISYANADTTDSSGIVTAYTHVTIDTTETITVIARLSNNTAIADTSYCQIVLNTGLTASFRRNRDLQISK